MRRQHRILARASALAALLALVACGPDPASPLRASVGERWPAIELAADHAGDAACVDCHAENHRTWHASYHRTMTQAASAEAILAPWSGRTPVDEGAAWRLERDDESFLATPVSRDEDREGERMRVVLTTGSHHYQLYWLANDATGELIGMPFAWHLGDEAWVPRRSLFLYPPHDETLYEVDRWQRVCIKCHTTAGIPDPMPRASAFGISCESCHGPSAAHVAFRRADDGGADEENPPVVPSALEHERASMICGQCHGIHPFAGDDERAAWREQGFAYRPGDDLHATRQLLRGTPARTDPRLRRSLVGERDVWRELFWSDGEVRVSGREYNGLVESPCFQRGELSCLSCHEMHARNSDPRPLSDWADDQLAPGMGGDRACTQCHAVYTEPERLVAHTNHAAESPGSRCMNCHMPYTTYGLTKAIRSHTITSPSVGATLATGRPNACNGCHLDRPLGWTANALRRWFGHPRPVLTREDETIARTVIDALSGDAGQRALAAWALGWEPARASSGVGWSEYLVSTLLMDPYDAVARVALRTARLDPRFEDLELDFTLPFEARARPVVERVIAAWVESGLRATPEQREAVLVREDGTLADDRVRALMGRRDDRDVRLAE